MILGSFSTEPVDLSAVDIKPLDGTVNRAAFCCGNDRIDNFFKNNSRRQHESYRVRVYVAYHNRVSIGYYYLVAATHPPDKVSKEAIEKFGRVNATPCVYLGMLGVQSELQGNGVGKLLMLHAMKTTLDVAKLIGIYALSLTAIDEDTAKRYERWGFTRFIAGELDMFIPVSTIRDAIEDRN